MSTISDWSTQIQLRPI
uniref:Uncharacterized protein n=1 Tax=Arundo donax TaxID=35708 RepID=A0A0A8YCC5_ARUDO